MKKTLFIIPMTALSLVSCGTSNSSSSKPPMPLTNAIAITTEATTVQPSTEIIISSYTITGGETGEYGSIKSFNDTGTSPFKAIYYKLPAGEYKVSCVDSASFSIVRDNIHVYLQNEMPNPDIIDFVESSIDVKPDEPAYITIHGDESILFEQKKELDFSMIAEPAENLYCIIGEETGLYGSVVTLGANTDMPVDKYLYKIPAGKYKVTTTFKKLANFSIVKDVLDSNADELQYVGSPYSMTAGNDDFNGHAKKELEITISDDESICVVGNNEFLFLEIQ